MEMLDIYDENFIHKLWFLLIPVMQS